MKQTKRKAKLLIEENVNYQVFDKNGNLKKLFKMNKFGTSLLKLFRKISKSSNLSLYGIKIPFITGRSTFSLDIANLITNAGMAGAAGRLNAYGSPAAFDYIAVGTGTNAAAVTDTTLQTETTTSGLGRAQGTTSLVTTTVTNDTAQVLKSFSVTGTVAVTESGLLNAASTGTLLARQVFSAINVANGDTLQITWKIKASG